MILFANEHAVPTDRDGFFVVYRSRCNGPSAVIKKQAD